MVLIGKGLFRAMAVVVLTTYVVIPCALARDLPPPGECPQPRFTGKAPPEFYQLLSPLDATADNIKAGRKLYRRKPHPTKLACATCHGKKGDGKGPMAEMFDPPPRNFACAETVNGIPDGQLFWIIRNGSPGTSMPNHHILGDRNIWLLVLYLRELAK